MGCRFSKRRKKEPPDAKLPGPSAVAPRPQTAGGLVKSLSLGSEHAPSTACPTADSDCSCPSGFSGDSDRKAEEGRLPLKQPPDFNSKKLLPQDWTSLPCHRKRQVSAETALQFLLLRMQNEDWVAYHDDVAYYFRAPLAFVEAGDMNGARLALSIAGKFVADGRAEGSKMALYGLYYPQYPLLCIGSAAKRLGHDTLSQQCFRKLRSYRAPYTSSGTLGRPYSRAHKDDNVCDFIATALLGKAGIEAGDEKLVIDAADSLLRAIAANRAYMQDGHFYLRWTWSGGFLKDGDGAHCMKRGASRQLYSLCGLSADFLFEAGMRGSRYKEAGMELTAFLDRCGGESFGFASPQRGRVAARTRNWKAWEDISDRLVQLQQPCGCFGEDASTAAAMDEAADVAMCLLQNRQLPERKQGDETTSNASFPIVPQRVPSEVSQLAGANDNKSSGNTKQEVVPSHAKLDGLDPACLQGLVPHSMVARTFQGPTWCEECHGFMWGLVQQGTQCDLCGKKLCHSCTQL
eukprot:TRINITY_DN45294_c0_g1_i1.p1 TRINITY_DN45294_c0_g1~~TRINITY_DN45294_c0_g1_i1.p1  ORF type:complete len:518 (+),score=85.09 TRINITY_DN45294_c0_g1_i1:131-1684(+)